MAEGIVYLDVDDEITSAASRIRSAAGTRVALVVPYGSRIATSRMNFRLLSREALVSNKRLSIVSGDAGSRSLAASAGLPVFGSVGEYESSLSRPLGAGSPDVAPSFSPSSDATPVAASAASPLAASETVVEPDLPSDPPAPPVRKSQRPKRPAPDPDETTTIATGAAAASPTPGPGSAAFGDADGWTRPVPTPAIADPPDTRPVRETARPRLRDDLRDDDRDTGTALPGVFGGRLRASVLAAIGLIGLAAVVAAVGAYLFLPSASIRLTPRQEPIGPIPITVAADPEATAVDVANGIVPALRIDVPVEAAKTFETTGQHVELAAASGQVTFQNYDPTSQNTIVSGSVVSTEGGIRFRTVATAIIPKATFIFPPGRVEPSSRSVGVEADKDGPGGNVAANSIRSVPRGENPEFLKVNNPAPTAGGSRAVTPEVTKAEVAQAVSAVRADLQEAFDAAIAGGAGAPPGTTLFAETAGLGDVVVDGDPQALVGEAVPTFDVRMTAKGSVVAVDPTPVQSIAEARLTDEVGADHRLVDGSVDIVVGKGSVGEDGQITFESTARATRVAVVDAASLRDLVKGRTAADAKVALAPYGDAVVTLWPDWVTTVTSMDSRLDVTVVDGGGSAPAGSVAPSRTPARASPSSVSPAPPASVAASAAP